MSDTATLTVGTHLITPRTAYVHHGLYAGCGMVIHYSGLSDGLRGGPVEEVTLDDFSNGHRYESVDSHSALYPGVEAVYRARQRIGEDRYNLLTNNCEHFVHWCLYGTHRSEQINRTLKAAGGLVASRYGGSLLAGASAPVSLAILSGVAVGYGIHRYLKQQQCGDLSEHTQYPSLKAKLSGHQRSAQEEPIEVPTSSRLSRR